MSLLNLIPVPTFPTGRYFLSLLDFSNAIMNVINLLLWPSSRGTINLNMLGDYFSACVYWAAKPERNNQTWQIMNDHISKCGMPKAIFDLIQIVPEGPELKFCHQCQLEYSYNSSPIFIRGSAFINGAGFESDCLTIKNYITNSRIPELWILPIVGFTRRKVEIGIILQPTIAGSYNMYTSSSVIKENFSTLFAVCFGANIIITSPILPLRDFNNFNIIMNNIYSLVINPLTLNDMITVLVRWYFENGHGNNLKNNSNSEGQVGSKKVGSEPNSNSIVKGRVVTVPDGSITKYENVIRKMYKYYKNLTKEIKVYFNATGITLQYILT